MGLTVSRLQWVTTKKMLLQSCNSTLNKYPTPNHYHCLCGEIQAHTWNTHAYNTLDILSYMWVFAKNTWLFFSLCVHRMPFTTVILKLFSSGQNLQNTIQYSDNVCCTTIWPFRQHCSYILGNEYNKAGSFCLCNPVRHVVVFRIDLILQHIPQYKVPCS